MYRLIATDMDGTLLNSSCEVSEANRRALRSAMEKGVRIIICSGRTFKGSRIFAEAMGLRDPIIACNGSIIKDPATGDVLYSNLMNKEDCLRIVELCHKADIYFHAYIDDTYHSERFERQGAYYDRLNRDLPPEERFDIRIVKDFSEVIEKSAARVSKFVIASENGEKLKKLREQVKRIDTTDIMSSQRDNFEVVNRGVSKGNALRFLAEKLNISRDEIIAMGDNENDCSMLEFAGLGVAMGNADEKIKRMARYVAKSNDGDGVADVITKFILAGKGMSRTD